MQGDAIVQVAQGEAAVLDGDRPAARQKAIDDALRRAVEMAAGTRVSSTTETKDFQIRMDRVLTHAHGFVRRYEIVNEGVDGAVGQLIDPEIAAEKTVQVGGIATEITGAQARKLKSLTGAEVILFGQAVATARGEVAELGPGWRSCSATISGRAVNTDNGDILSTAETTQNAA